MSNPTSNTTKDASPVPEIQSPGRVLVVDDQPGMALTLAAGLRLDGFVVDEAQGGQAALEQLGQASYDVVVTDQRMDGVDGLAVLKQALSLQPGVQVLVMTAFGTIDAAVQALQAGACDYLAKPFDEGEFRRRVAQAAERRRQRRQLQSLTREPSGRPVVHDRIIGRSQTMRELLTRAVKVAQTDATVLITGESGTGKELVARAIHANSRRASGPFLPVNCAAIPESLLESELFGHARGAYTGAVRARRGLLEEAAGGTLFLDEIADTTPGFQAKLLRALQEGEVRRVGENAPVRVDVRMIAATHVDLRQAMVEKRFREDLFYRLNVVPLRLPALRERRDDIPLLAQHFLERFNERNGTAHSWGRGALERLFSYEFPGNVRELENLVEQAAALAAGDEISAQEVRIDGPRPATTQGPQSLYAAAEAAEKLAIEQAIDACQGEMLRVAKRLQVSYPTLWRKMRRYGIQRSDRATFDDVR